MLQQREGLLWALGVALCLASGCTYKSVQVDGAHVRLTAPGHGIDFDCKGGSFRSRDMRLNGKELAEFLTTVIGNYSFRFLGGRLQAALDLGRSGGQLSLGNRWLDDSLGAVFGGGGGLRVGGRAIAYDVDRVCRQLGRRLVRKVTQEPAPAYDPAAP